MRWDEQIVLLGLGLVGAILAKKAGVDGSYDKNAENIKKDLRALHEAETIVPHGSPFGLVITESITKVTSYSNSGGRTSAEKADALTENVQNLVATAQVQIANNSSDQTIVEHPASVTKVTDDQISKLDGIPLDQPTLSSTLFSGPAVRPIIFPVRIVEYNPSIADVERAKRYKQSIYPHTLNYGRLWLFPNEPGLGNILPDNIHVSFFRPSGSGMGYFGTNLCENVNKTAIKGDVFQTAVWSSNTKTNPIFKGIITGDTRCIFTIGPVDTTQVLGLCGYARHWGALVPRYLETVGNLPIFRYDPTFIPPGYSLLSNGGYEAD